MTSLNEQLGQRIRELRKISGDSQEVFASKANLDRTYIADIEKGKRNVSLEVVYKLAVALNISIEELVKGFGCKNE